MRTRWPPLLVVGLYAVLSGSARFLVEEIRINSDAVLGLTQPQLWSALLVTAGMALLVTGSLRGRPPAGGGSDEMVSGGTAGRDVVHYRC